MPGLLLGQVIVRKSSPDPRVPSVGAGHRPGGGGRGRPWDVVRGLDGVSPGVRVTLVAWLLVAGAGVLALQSPRPEKRTFRQLVQ